MPLSRPTHDELVARVAADMDAAFGGGTVAAVDATRLHAFVEHHAGLFHAFYGEASEALADIIPSTASLAGLQRWGKVFDVPLKPAVAALGSAVGGIDTGTTLLAGTLLASGGDTYEVISDVAGAVGPRLISVRSLTPGSSGGRSPGAMLRLVVSIPGVSDDWLVLFPGVVGGDEEDVESYRARIVDVFRNPPLGGATHDFRRWALQVPGVERAWAIPADIIGLGRVAVYIVTAESELVPPAALVDDVRAFIRARCRSDVNLIVSAPFIGTLNVAANVPGLALADLTNATKAATATVTAALHDAPAALTPLPTGLGIPDVQERLFRTTITTALDAALGRLFTITSPPSDIVPAYATLSVYRLGSLTLTPT